MPNVQPSIDKKEHDASKAAKRVIPVDAFGGSVTDGNYTTIIDKPTAVLNYFGKAQIGTSTASAGWQIKRMTVSGTVTKFEWAGGTDSFTNVWDNRGSLSYS